MAKLKAPLLSFSASGQIGKTAVYFPWKGINAVRKHVVPANPQTTPQLTQRGYVTTAVAKIHEAMATATDAISDVDKAAYSLWAAVLGMTMTWFNTAIKNYVDQMVAGKQGVIYRGFTLTPAAGQVTVQGNYAWSGVNDITAGAIWYGTSKSALLSSVSCTGAELIAGKVVGSLTAGTKYYFQYRPTLHANFVGAYSGIYHATPT